ncbi:uncharacterized protein Z518_10961 [Rhinocladiella mackenziei CBS 650.93]|uniref:Rhinocladiella mackenziei CBS 650.93 unplaced genomic scaffold supercont1.10, whole genome shotgun sequence n=1 Tax=Rhinocladiella mackenziei CBS 650.93 TaxID=1442369 RepID=A0A0D2I2S8_9EURO|nr:uncharacterized protein Z518_10961 [Rhinocladiella mackenziei CBS 650.93]KIX00034.1 hypothetical protein Z518_10961 [Rhinocladiella mackenziei CBS 650.93]
MPSKQVLFFGDEVVSPLPAIHNLYRQARSSITIQRFLSEATRVVKLEICKLQAEQRDRWPGFDTIIELAETWAKQELPGGAVNMTLVCISRLGELLKYAHMDPQLLGTNRKQIHMLGLCTGLLPAAAASVAQTTAELFDLSLVILALTVRCAAQILHRSRSIDDAPRTSTWGYLVTSMPAEKQQELIDKFHADQRIPRHRSAYLSVIADQWTTLTGPPSTLTQLFASCPELCAAPHLALPIEGAVHAPHLPLLDFDFIIGSSAFHGRQPSPDATIISPSSLKPYRCQSLRDLLHEMLVDISQNPLYVNSAMDAALGLPANDPIDVTVVGPTTQTTLLKRLLDTAGAAYTIQETLESPTALPGDRASCRDIAVVGFAGRFPGGKDMEELWNTIHGAKDLHREIPNSRFDVNEYYDSSGLKKNSISTKYGCFLSNPGEFDTRLFNLSPREVLQMDPMQRLFLMTTYEALEAAGQPPYGDLPQGGRRVASFFGQAADDQKEINNDGTDIYYVPGVARAFYPGRINHHFKWTGPTFSVDSACASSCSAILLASSELNAGNCDMAVVGGGSILSSPRPFSGLSKGGFLSATGGCKTFRADADGYCRGEGVGVVVLKRLEDALQNNDNIHAVIRAGARNANAGAVSITHPDAEAQERLYRQVLQQGCLQPSDISYVEFHGTATQAGDTAEMISIGNALGKDRSSGLPPLYVGSIKANIGHSEAAAGVTALIKCCLMLQKDEIPPQVGMPAKLNVNYPRLEELNIQFPHEPVGFEASATSDGVRRILLNNFDAAGGNASLLIEDAPAKQSKEQDPRRYHIVALSARSSSALKKAKHRLVEFLLGNVVSIADVAYTSTARRGHDIFRSAYVSSSADDLLELVEADVSAEAKRVSDKITTVFLFTGQGAQYSGMGRTLFRNCRAFRECILACQKQAEFLGFPPFADLIADDSVDVNARSTIEIQLAIVSLEIALARTWNSWGIFPTVVVGHSLGEYAALCVAGVLSLSDTLYLVGHRATLVQKHCSNGTYGMLSVRLGVAELQSRLASSTTACEISCINNPASTVVSGQLKDIKTFSEDCDRAGIRTDMLKNAYGFHSIQMDTVLADYETLADGVVFNKPLIPVASTLEGKIVRETGTFSSSYMVRQMRQPVDFLGAINACRNADFIKDDGLWLEVGPSPVCLGLASACVDIPTSQRMASLKPREDNFKTISTSLHTAYSRGIDIDWKAFHSDHAENLNLLHLPTYAFDVKDFWTTFKEPALASMRDDQGIDRTSSQDTKVQGFPTTTLQRVETESLSATKVAVDFVSKTAEPNLLAVMQGHIVNGKPICPSSVFADMAYTAGRYIHQKLHPGKSIPPMSIEDLNLTQALTLAESGANQIIRVSAVASAESGWTVAISFHSQNKKQLQTHGGCSVRFGDSAEWQESWNDTAYLVRGRIESIRDSARIGKTERLSRRYVYKLFNNVVSYSDQYQGMSEVILGPEDDGVAVVNFKPVPNGAKFTYAPYWLDPLVQLAGFLLNGSVDTPDDIAYFSAGVRSLRIMGEPSETKTYLSYVRMRQARQNGVLTGDVYIFEDDKVIGVCGGVMFQRMPKRILHSILFGQSRDTVAPAGHMQGKTFLRSSPPSGQDTPRDSYYNSVSTVTTGVNTPWSSDSEISSAATSDVGVLDAENIFSLALKTIATETGYPVEDMHEDTVFEDMGVDSLMSVAIIDAIKRSSNISVPAAFFTAHPTVGAMRKALSEMAEPVALEEPKFSKPEKDAPKSAKAVSVDKERREDPPSVVRSIGQPDPPPVIALSGSGMAEQPPAPTSEKEKSKSDVVQATKTYSSNVVLLQGRPSSGQIPLFLLVDGAGSSTAYLHLPFFPNRLPVYALESPFLHCPLDYTISINEMAQLFVDAIRKTQPRGPYMLGGWSAGSAYAYEVARILIDGGETVLGLILLDMRVPRPMPDGLEPTMEILDQVGLTVGIKRAGKALGAISEKQRQHLLSTVKQLMVYNAQPMPEGKRPLKTVVIWARKGMIDVIKEQGLEIPEWAQGIEDVDGNVMEDEGLGLVGWFYGKRTNFGPNGWDKLLGEVETHVVEGADHFSLVTPPTVRETARFMQDAVAAFISKA